MVDPLGPSSSVPPSVLPKLRGQMMNDDPLGPVQ